MAKRRTAKAKPPPCPSHLDSGAKKCWARMVKLLPAKALSIVDVDQLALYCAATSRWEEAEREMALLGPVVGDEVSPHFTVANIAMRQMNAYLANLRKLIDREPAGSPNANTRPQPMPDIEDPGDFPA